MTKLFLPRRKFLIGTAAVLFCAPAIVRAENIMRIREPRIKSIRLQTWPFGSEEDPHHHMSGWYGNANKGLTYWQWEERLREESKVWGQIYWRPLP